jgi:type IV pilus assembly protein PilA
MKTCHGCGRLNPDAAASCVKCGHALSAEPLPVAPDLPVPRAAEEASPFLPTQPPADPRPAKAPHAAVHDDFDEEAWRAVIGPKAQDHYLPRFREMAAAGGEFRVGWHWPALFLSGYWMLYRKAWLATLLYPVLSTIFAFVVGLIVGAAGVDPDVAGALAVLGVVVAPPLMAHWVYFRKCRSVVDGVVPGESRERYLERLARRGGTSWTPFILIGMVAVLGVLAAVALPAYVDYTNRAKVSAVLQEVFPLAHAAGDEYQRTGVMPPLPALPASPALRPVESLASDPATGIIEIRLVLGPSAPAGSIFLVPSADAARHVSWACQATPRLLKAASRHCTAVQ